MLHPVNAIMHAPLAEWMGWQIILETAVERTRSGLNHWVNIEKPCNVKMHALSLKVSRGQLPFQDYT